MQLISGPQQNFVFQGFDLSIALEAICVIGEIDIEARQPQTCIELLFYPSDLSYFGCVIVLLFH